ncbi:MAG: helicase RepA family protein [Chloroflexota bacterium]|nr:helicase RepA family protein [Chloroflexota bacterium]
MATQVVTQNVQPFRPLTLSQLKDLSLPQLEAVVESLLFLGTLTLFAAREKSGKSLLMIDLICSVALDEPFLGRAVRAGPVVYVPAEDNLRDVRDRLNRRLGGRDGPIHVLPVNGYTEDALRLDDPASLARLRAMIEEIEPVLVVLDPMRELHTRREDVADEMGPMLRPLRQIAHETNTAVILNHHMSKGGSARGSTAITAAVDQIWTFHLHDPGG